MEHARANEVLRVHGFEFDSWLSWYQRVAYGWIEPRVPAILCLSVTAALEHLTASLAHYHLTTNPMRSAAPVMRDLMRWHAAEEIEHKSVAFNVLQAVDNRWIVRATGMVLALIGFLFFWSSAWRHLSRQDPNITRARIRADRQIVSSWGIQDARYAVFRYAFGYFRYDFHPDDNDNYALAAEALAELEERYQPALSKAG
jgi:predicted metal-dependent hydrolase